MKSQQCEVCGKQYFKSINCSNRKWEKSRFCSSVCFHKGMIGRECPWKGKKLAWPVWNKGLVGVQAPWNKGKKFPQVTGENSYAWKGLNASLVAKHNWVARRLGRPKKCKFCGVEDRKMYHWANLSGKYLRDVTDYIRLCVPCHKKFDLAK
jgi:hypothetical protein